MQVELTRVRSAQEAPDLPKVNEKEFVILSEIGLELIPTATSFVEYIAEKYEVSASGIWYTLKKLKKMRVVDFTEKGEELRPLSLTEQGKLMIRRMRTMFSRSSESARVVERVGITF